MHPVWRDFVALFCSCVALVPLRVCSACVEFLGVLLVFFCCLLFSSKIPTLSPPQFTSLSHNALPHTPSRISSKSFSKIQESPASASSSLLAGAKHDPGDKVDDGCSWLVWVQLSKEVADVVCGAPLLPGHEAEEPVWGEGKSLNIAPATISTILFQRDAVPLSLFSIHLSEHRGIIPNQPA